MYVSASIEPVVSSDTNYFLRVVRRRVVVRFFVVVRLRVVFVRLRVDLRLRPAKPSKFIAAQRLRFFFADLVAAVSVPRTFDRCPLPSLFSHKLPDCAIAANHPRPAFDLANAVFAGVMRFLALARARAAVMRTAIVLPV